MGGRDTPILVPGQPDEVGFHDQITRRAPARGRVKELRVARWDRLAEPERGRAQLQNQRVDAEPGVPERAQIVARLRAQYLETSSQLSNLNRSVAMTRLGRKRGQVRTSQPDPVP